MCFNPASAAADVGFATHHRGYSSHTHTGLAPDFFDTAPGTSPSSLLVISNYGPLDETAAAKATSASSEEQLPESAAPGVPTIPGIRHHRTEELYYYYKFMVYLTVIYINFETRAIA